LLIFNVYWMPHQWLAQSWYEIVGSGDRNHRAAGSHVKRVKNWYHCRAYISKYMAKPDESGVDVEGWGRWWGIANRVVYNESLTEVLAELPSAIFYRVRRTLARYVNAQYRRRGGRFRLKSPYPPGGVGVFLPSDMAFRLLAFCGEPA
jgi:hypothetical protein